jgi:ABC-type multidrug transport system fused ATPase/permease subunit
MHSKLSLTAAIDYKTDAVIQSSLRNELGPDVTLLTVAHRLQTIMDADKIVSILSSMVRFNSHAQKQMVLDAGRIVSPSN